MALSVFENGRLAGSTNDEVYNGTGGMESCPKLAAIDRERDRLTFAAVKNARNLAFTAQPARGARAVGVTWGCVKS